MADGPLTPLAMKMGGMDKVAEATGVHWRTVSKWNRKERIPEAPARRMLAMLAAQHGVEPPFSI